jgi:hypothetical protein
LEEIAGVIRQVSLDSGARPLYYRRSSLAYWSNGVTPQADAIPVLVEAMSRLLNRPDLSSSDLGWPDQADQEPDQQHPWHGDAVARLALLGRSSLDRRAFLGSSIFLLSALDVPQQPWEQTRPTGDPTRVGAGDIARVREMTSQFAQADSLFGGAEALPSLGAYITQVVVPMLRARSGNRAPDLFTAASDLAYIGGWMSTDAGQAGLAQRYYVLAARLADEAGDRSSRATALRGLALHAIEMGIPAKPSTSPTQPPPPCPPAPNHAFTRWSRALWPRPTPQPARNGQRSRACARPKPTWTGQHPPPSLLTTTWLWHTRAGSCSPAWATRQPPSATSPTPSRTAAAANGAPGS